MDQQEDDLTADPLFVGLTRPTMIGGVTYQAAILHMVVSTSALVLTKNPLHLAICLPIHAVFYAICARDPRAFELLQLWLQTKGWNLIARGFRSYWKASSYSPLPFKIRK